MKEKNKKKRKNESAFLSRRADGVLRSKSEIGFTKARRMASFSFAKEKDQKKAVKGEVFP
jgi:hypothetical protein